MGPAPGVESIAVTHEPGAGQASSCEIGIRLLALKIAFCLSCLSRSTRTVPAQSQPDANEAGWIPLFNGKNLDGWYTWLPSTGRDNDPNGVFKVEDGVLHILDLPADGSGAGVRIHRDQQRILELPPSLSIQVGFETLRAARS